MQVFYDILPIFIFFTVYKLAGIYYATAAAMIASCIQVTLYYCQHKRFEKMQTITFCVIWVLGLATIVFHNPLFIKWKPTVVYWLFAGLFVGGYFFGHKPFIQYLMGEKLALPRDIWHRLNVAWIIFFLSIGTLNLYVAYHYSTETWVNFKLFGVLGMTLIFTLLQAIYLNRYVPKE